ncbi:GNAT family N-acetyltransferase [Paracoccus aminophilus]|uniref:Acetyltransferase n=1 Tax=Paracoccus aminophilus JCM 7686 TaxID=1367847 RepID=S5XYE0_PARAH|nr:GNAT family N-acetyltransferase [Paracoccus aminophilus]AGT10337.1 acetyltransferase [Paracoccus aminophilus JCM 7686]
MTESPTPTDLPIHKEKLTGGGRYVLRLPDLADEAELSWHDAAPGVIVADHTFVPTSMRGRNIASALVARLIADARAHGLKIVPQCPYVRAQFDRHADWADLRAVL